MIVTIYMLLYKLINKKVSKIAFKIRGYLLRFYNSDNIRRETNKSFLRSPGSSILLQNTEFDFRIGREDRIYIEIGDRCLISAKFTFETKSGKVTIGNNVHLGGVHFITRSSISIADDVTMAWGITIYDHDSHSIYWEHRQHDNTQCYTDYIEQKGNNIVNKDWSNVKSKQISIGPKAWIGFGVTILKGVTIGEGAVIGAMSVVTKDIPAWSIAAGNPARVVKYLEKVH